MIFELDEALIDEIIFFMENQSDESVFDTLECTIISRNPYFDTFETDEESDDDDDSIEGRYIDLPEWTTQDGFRLMEHFTAGLKNPVAREELSKALNRGKGVFRLFKDVLTRYPQIEKQWYKYKESEMKKEVIDWYNSYREIWGLELIGPEPDDTSSLVLEDFHIREGLPSDLEKASSLHNACVSEAKVNAVYKEMNPFVFPGDICLVSETKEGDFAGFISAGKINKNLHITNVDIAAEYRGLGLGKTMLSKLIDKAREMEIDGITVDVPDGMEKLAQNLFAQGFSLYVKRFALNMP